MDITIIGAGNVGTVLGRVLTGVGHTIRQVYSREYENAVRLSQELKAAPVNELTLIDTRSDLYIISVTDDAVADVAAQLQLGEKLVIHTAGSISKQVLAHAGKNYGVLWPMKMIRKSMHELDKVTILIDGNSPAAIDTIEKIAKQFSDHVSLAGDEQRLKMHAVAAVVSNFTNHLYHLAADYCQKQGIDFGLFYPIIEATALQIQHTHPALVQAGPAFRKDLGTMEKHRQLLAKSPELAKLYDVMSESILSY